MPTISIIIPYFNVDKTFLSGCINSIINQSFRDFEVIIIDDGSNEKCAQIIKQYEAVDQRIRVYRKENGGVSSARNYGLSLSTGSYIIFVDADDILVDNFFEEAVNLQYLTNADIIVGGNIRYEKNETFANNTSEFDYRLFLNQEKNSIKHYLIGNTLKFGNDGGYIGRGPWTRLIKTELAESTLFDEGLSQGEDILWNLMILEKSNSICIANRIWYKYRHHNNSATHSFNPGILKEIEKELVVIGKHINLSNDREFQAFCELTVDSLIKVNSCFVKNNDDLIAKKITDRIYSCFPWSVLHQKRAYTLLSGRQKLYCLLYRLRLLYFALSFQRS